MTTKWLSAFPPSLRFPVPFLSTLAEQFHRTKQANESIMLWLSLTHSLTHSLNLSRIYFLFRLLVHSLPIVANRLEKSRNKQKRSEKTKKKRNEVQLVFANVQHLCYMPHPQPQKFTQYDVVLIDTTLNACLCQCIRCMCIIYLYLYIYSFIFVPSCIYSGGLMTALLRDININNNNNNKNKNNNRS